MYCIYLCILFLWIWNLVLSLWAGFNRIAHQAFLVDIVNVALLALSIQHPLSALLMPTTYLTLEPTTTFYQSYVRRLAQTKFIDLEHVIPILRHFQQKIHELNNTSIKLGKLLTQVHVKHVTQHIMHPMGLKIMNQFFAIIITAFGGPGNEFTVAIQLVVIESAYGIKWFNSTSIARLHYDISIEIAYWREFRITKYHYLWHNYAATGISETIYIQTTLGTENAQQYCLDNNDFFWLLGNDWSTAQHLNNSVVRGANNGIRNYGPIETLLGMDN
ncbi:hypothetical protein THRCLA_09085 [Thraustotheca clavata]|uniref:Uncharacterized protein n=1 Tax=Thraustotheca clavata TaxID=74557 RepID=A0A1V9Z046_9STRA|nr:hypothetical protein THRCLA_09085 [Thraustotheca clavata]